MKSDKHIDVMIDIETLGLVPGCKILQIAACTFNHEGEKAEFNMFIERKSQLLVEDAGTVAWWEKQDEFVKARVFGGTVQIAAVLASFASWLKSIENAYGKKVRVWGNAASFDISILEAAYKAYFFAEMPWKYWNVMCFRTLKNLYPQVLEPKFEGDKHDAVFDTYHQAKWAKNIADYKKSCEGALATIITEAKAAGLDMTGGDINHAYEG